MIIRILTRGRKIYNIKYRYAKTRQKKTRRQGNGKTEPLPPPFIVPKHLYVLLLESYRKHLERSDRDLPAAFAQDVLVAVA